MEAIVLAGGFGTRLSHIVKDVPKPMALVRQRPFLYYLLSDLIDKGITKIILAVGYRNQVIQKYFGSSFRGIPIEYSVENTPLFTGGAVKKAISRCNGEDIFIINGDTFFDIKLRDMYRFHKEKKSDCTIATNYMENYDRYGTIVSDKEGKIIAFQEKNKMEKGYINGGIYIINKMILSSVDREVFSFEKDFLEKKYNELYIYSFKSSQYFIDIGVEEDYYKVQTETIFLKDIFSLRKAAFFDRDGTINVEKNYLYRIEEFEFIPGMPELIKRYNESGYLVLVVTNQAGIARGYYTEEDMNRLHSHINCELSKWGAHIDAFYFCPHHPDFTGECNCRKPKTGMLEKAIKEWNVDVTNSILYGDKSWDIEAGEKMGIRSVLLNN